MRRQKASVNAQSSVNSPDDGDPQPLKYERSAYLPHAHHPEVPLGLEYQHHPEVPLELEYQHHPEVPLGLEYQHRYEDSQQYLNPGHLAPYQPPLQYQGDWKYNQLSPKTEQFSGFQQHLPNQQTYQQFPGFQQHPGYQQFRDYQQPSIHQEQPVTQVQTPELGIIGSLFKSTLDLFKLIVQSIHNDDSLHEHQEKLQHYLGTLYFWGDGFGATLGELDRALEQSIEIRNTVLSILIATAEVVSQGLLQHLSNKRNFSWQTLEVKNLIKGAREITNEEETATEGMTSMDDILKDLETYTDCLTDLSSSIDCPAQHIDGAYRKDKRQWSSSEDENFNRSVAPSPYGSPLQQSRQPQTYGQIPTNNEVGRIQKIEKRALNQGYQKQLDPDAFFIFGRVFLLWSKPAREVDPKDKGHSDYIESMVVVRPGKSSCWCLPISSFSGLGANKPGVYAEDLTIIYIRGEKVEAFPGERERGMYKEPIEVVPFQGQKLNKGSRIDFGTVHTVRHDLSVMEVGMVSTDSMAILKQYWVEALDGSPGAVAPF